MSYRAEIPYGAYWSTPYAKWQGSFANLNSIEFAAQIVIEELFLPNSVAVTIFVIIFQAAVAIGILTRGAAVRPALVAGGIFSICFRPQHRYGG